MLVKRAISVEQLERMRFTMMKLEGKFAESFGEEVERSGSWIIYAESGNGKTEFALQLAKELTKYGKVLYNSLEEGARSTFKKAVNRQAFNSAERRRFKIVSDEIAVLRERLFKQKSPDIIFIDSIQFAGLTKAEYKKFIQEFPNKLFIWISHADGKKPLGSLAVHIEYNSDIKAFVQGFRAMIKSRYEANTDFIINEARANDYWNEIL